jgi:hypothetical protein
MQRHFIEEALRGDNDALTTYHECAPCTFEEAIYSTHATIKSVNPIFIALFNGENYVGYITDFRWPDGTAVLHSFCVRMEYRTAEILEAFWRFISIYMPDVFLVYLYDRNKRAIRWIREREPFIERLVEHDDNIPEPYRIFAICQ